MACVTLHTLQLTLPRQVLESMFISDFPKFVLTYLCIFGDVRWPGEGEINLRVEGKKG